MAENARMANRPQRTENVVARTLDGEAVLLDLASEEYYSLNEVGSRIWELADGEHSVGDMVEAIVTDYDAERAQVEEDVLDLLDELSREGLVSWGDNQR
jgi:hypothetical protein